MYLQLNKEELVKKFVANLLETNRGFNFYVNWDNALGFKTLEIELNAMNVLIRCNNFDEKFKELLTKLPSVVKTFPLLFALAKKEREYLWSTKSLLKIVNDSSDMNSNVSFSFYNQPVFTKQQIENYLFFVEKIGIKKLLLELLEKNLIDYVIGVLVGLDTNGRKNRGGNAFEEVCLPLIEKVCNTNKITLIKQKPFKDLKKWGFEVNENIANRKADFILLKENKILNIEVNFYGTPGSKPEEIIDSYLNRQTELHKNKFNFALITDGLCWNSETKNQLIKGLSNIEYMMNYNLAKQGMLEEVIFDWLNKK